jgi:hypothetical protein
VSELEKKVLEQIMQRRLAPRPYAYFLAKRSVFWMLAATSTILGGIAVAVLIYGVTDYAATGGAGFDELPLDDFLIILPPIWLTTLAIFVASAIHSVRQTPRGYRCNTLTLVAIALTLSLTFGCLLHLAGAGQRTHAFLAGYIPLYERFTRPLDKTVADPDKGWLAGTALSFDGKSTLVMRDFGGRIWTVDVQGAKVTLDEPLGSDEDISIKGERTGVSTFHAQSIKDWD